MARPIATKHNTITALLGTIWETVYVRGNVMRQVIVKADTSSTVFDVSIENSHGDEVFRINDITGEIVEEVNLYFAEAGTIKILNSTVDEDFTYTLTVEE